jgi:gliding motility-associated-like protein
VDYQVCGTVPCTGNVCDTVRVYFNPTLAATIVPQNPTICYGNTTTVITAVGSGGTPPYNYSWSTGATTQSINATVGTYTVTISDTSNCPPVTATVTVTAFANPITANAGPDQNVCSNSPTVQLNGTVTGANGGIWSGGSGIFSPNNTTLNATYTPTPAEIANGTVTLQLTTTGNGTCPADSDVMVIHIHTFSGTAAMTHTDVTCNGLNNGTITVSMSGGSPPYTFSWNMNPAQTSATATGLAPGTYTVTITDAFGCTGTASAAVTQPQPLSLNTAGFSTSCNGSCNGQAVCIPSGGNGNYSYNWMPGNASGASYANLCPGTYTVTVTDQLGCTASDTAIVNQPTVINISTSSVPAHCQHPDGSASANASGGVPPYTYTWTPGNQFGPNVTGLLPGNYTVTVTDFNGCTKNAPVIVGDLPGVVASITSVTNVSCANTCNGAASGNASGGNGPYAYFWNSSPPQTTINATGLCAGSYSFYVVDGNGCSSNASTNITQPLPVTITGTSAPVTICIGQGTTLSATATGGTGNYTYSWSPAGPNVSPTTTATYTVIAIDANGCTSTGQTITVTVHPPISLNATGSTVTCSGSPVQLNANANGGNGGPYNYVWMPGNLNGTSVTVSPTVTTTYTVTASDGCSPNVSMTVPVNVEQLPVVAFTANNTSGCTGACVQFTCTTPNAAAWSWNFGDGGTSNMQNPLYCYSHPGSYAVSLTVTGSNGCSASQTNNNMIVIHANPTADFAMGPQPTTILEPRICFHDLSSPDVTQWYWNFDDPNDLLTSSNQNPCHEYSDTGKYCASLIVHNQYGCWSTVTYCLVIQPYFSIYVPNAFTPNDDGLNDMFYPKGNNISPDDYHLWIYDRWGSKIFESENLNKGWDGRANGGDEIVQLGVYVWKIHVKDFEGKSHELIGSVSVIK